MRQREKKRQIRRRLMTGVFCISLLFADLTSVIPVWAQETVVAEQSQGSGENEPDETMNPEDENQGEVVQNPEENNSGEETSSSDEENAGDNAQNPDEENAGDNAQNPDEGDAGDNAQNPDEEGEGNNTQNPEEEDGEADDVTEETDLSEEEEQKDAEETDSVSENDMEEQGEVRTLAASGADIASGTYENIMWVIDANGKLTVNGRGEFAKLTTPGSYNGNRAPWKTKSSSIKSAVINVTGMTDASYMFSGCINLTEINFDGFDTSTIKNMKEMFSNCLGLVNLDLGDEFDTSHVTDMSGMFAGCRNLKKLNLGKGFDTSNVTDMSTMFSACRVLKDVDVSHFNTEKVTNMFRMFAECTVWGDLNLSGWDTSQVTDMSCMFMDCGFDHLTLGGRFTTKNVKSLNNMFAWYQNDPNKKEWYVKLSTDRIKLKGVDLSWLDLSNKPLLSGIFYGCDVKALDLGKLDTAVTTSLSGLFRGCDMTGVDFSDLKTDTITDMDSMFGNCTGTIDLSTLEHENVTQMSGMFEGDSSSDGTTKKMRFTRLDLSGLNTSKVTNMNAMFRSQDELKALDLSAFDVGKVVNMNYMFTDCNSLMSLDLSGWNADAIRYVPGMFSNCTSLTALDLSGFNFEKAGSGSINMGLDTCTALRTIYTPYNVKGNVTLPAGDWYMADGTKLTDNCLPKNLPYSVLIQKGKKPAAQTARMEVSKKKTAYSCGETLGTDDLTVTYYGTDGSIRKLAAKQGDTDGYTTNAAEIDMNKPGEKKLVITYQAGDKSLTAEITLTVTYELTADSTTITLSEDSYIYDGKAKTPKPAVAYSGSGQTAVQLTEGTDYIVSYSNNINAYEQSGASGSNTAAPTVIITGTGDYGGTVTKTFAIGKAAAPAAEEKTVVASRCTQADPDRTADLSGSFASCGKKTGYEVVSVDDPKNIFSKTPATADIQNGILKYGTNAAQENDTATIRIKVSFANYEDADLVVQVFMSEEGVVYTVRFDLMGHGDSFAKNGIRAGSLLELSEEERKPVAEGYLFAGWYQDKTFVSKSAWNFDTDTVQADLTLYACWLTGAAADSSGLQLYVQEIPDMTYTGSAQKPAVTVYDSDGKTILKAGKDYTIKYANNTNAVKIGENGEPEQGGGIAKVENPGKANEKITDVTGKFSKECPYVVITGKGNYTETIYRNFHILPANISAQGAGSAENTPLAAGFTLKYTDQFEAKSGKTAKIISSLKYKKALKEGSDYEVSVQEENGTPVTLTQGKIPLNTGTYELVVAGKGNYTGTVRRNLYVADKKNLMKNASVSYTKTVQAKDAEDLKKGIEPLNVTVKIGGKVVDAANYTIDCAGTNHAVGTATMTITGTNGYVGSKSVTFKITGRAFSAKTVEVKADDGSIQDGSGFKAVMTYTGRALTQNKVTLTTKADNSNPTSRELTYGDDYTITYKNNVKKGTATMTFTAKPQSGFSGSFKKNFKINAQELSKDRLEVLSEDAVYSAGGATLDFQLKNAEGMTLKQGTDYTVSYKNNKAATKESAGSSVKAGSKQPVMTIKGKGNYAGTLTVEFQIIPASIDSDSLTVTAAQVQRKNGLQLKDFKLKVTDGKTTLKVGKDYTIDESGCTPEIIQAYADSLGGQGATGTAGPGSEMPKEPKVVIKGMGNYGMQGDGAGGTIREISLADYIYTIKLTPKNLKVEVTGDRTYTGQNVEPTVKVSYYKDNDAAKQDGIGAELTMGTDYKVTYGSKNVTAGKNKGSVTITGAGIYGGSVTVKFDIEKKRIY